MSTLINGENEAQLSASDRGLAYGDGLFETIRVRQGKPEYWQAHMDRLVQGCRHLAMPEPDVKLLAQEARELLKSSPDEAVLKIILTRGPGGRGYLPPELPKPTRILSVHPLPDSTLMNRQGGVTVRLCKTRLGTQPMLAGIKHLNRLEQVLARAEWDDPAIVEGVMLDQDGNVVEGVMSNLFWLEGGRIVTPDLSACGVAGIMRGQVLSLCEELGWPVDQARFPVERLYKAEAVFLTNSLIGLRPVKQCIQGADIWVFPESEKIHKLIKKQKERSECLSGF